MVLLALLFACEGPERTGTAVGNPGSMDVDAVGAPPALELTAATLAVQGVKLWPCDGGPPVPVPAGVTLDGLVSSAQPVPVPPGRWCQTTIVPQDGGGPPLWLEGSTTGGTAFTVGLHPGDLVFAGAYSVDGDPVLLAVDVGAFLDVAELEAQGAVAAVVPDDPTGQAWGEAASDNAGLFLDADGDGGLSAPDLAIEPRADTGQYPLADANDAGCGCRSGGAPGSLLGLLLGFGLLLKKRRDRP